MTAAPPRQTMGSVAEPPTELLTSLTQEFRLRQSLRLRYADTETKRRRDPVLIAVALTASVLAVLACAYFLRQDRILGYHDSFSHLEISRRLLVGRTTGIAQLGAIWLPLPHVLQAIFAWNTTLYTTGLAGAIVSMTAFVACTVLIYRIVRVFSPRRASPAVAAAAVFMLGANMLYHQSTSMDELPFYAFALVATYGLVRWAHTQHPAYLLRAALGSMLAMLCRYEAWFLAGLFTVVVLVIARRTGHCWRDTRGLTGTFAVFGVLMSATGWVLYNWAVTGSPVNFLYGPNSSADQMAKRQGDVEIGSWSKSIHAYGAALIADHGVVLLALAAAGLVVFLAAERLSARSLPVLALAAIIPFYVVTIEGGQEPIGVPPVNPSLLNLRFALVAALPAAVFVGYLLARLPRRTVLAASVAVILGLAALAGNAFRLHSLVTVQEANGDLAAQQAQIQVADFLQHHTTGPIMLNLVGNERAAYPVLDRVIYEGTKVGQRNIWQQALRSPESTGAHIVLMRDAGDRGADDVYTALHDKPAMAGYHEIFHGQGYTIYQLGG